MYLKIKNRTENFNPLNHSYDGFSERILTQIKLKLSPLRSQLFQYNLIDNPFCPECGICLETPYHFFIECPGYELHRQVFFQNLDTLNSNLTAPNDIFNLILNGSTERNHDQRILSNKTIFRHTTIYMYKTGRFNPT